MPAKREDVNTLGCDTTVFTLALMLSMIWSGSGRNALEKFQQGLADANSVI